MMWVTRRQFRVFSVHCPRDLFISARGGAISFYPLHSFQGPGKERAVDAVRSFLRIIPRALSTSPLSLSISLSYSPLSLSSLSRSIWHRPPSSTPDVSRFGGISMAYRMYARITFANYELSPYTMPVMRLLEAYVIRLSSGENRARKYAGHFARSRRASSN